MVIVFRVLNYCYILIRWLAYLYFRFTVHTRPRVRQMRDVRAKKCLR